VYKFKKWTGKRYLSLYLFTAFFFALVIARLFSLQVRDGEAYKQLSDKRLSLAKTVMAPRGEITDRYGRPIVTNRTGYFVLLEKINETEDAKNRAILNIVTLLKQTKEEKLYKDSLPISKKAPFYFFSSEEEKKFKEENGFLRHDSAKEVLDALCARYHIDNTYQEEEARTIAGVRYGMEQEDFSVTTPYTLAEDVSVETVTKIKEQQEFFPCVTVSQKSLRAYLYPETAVHILGRVGKISEEEYDALKSKGYQKTDTVGKQGIEKAFEEVLRGTEGIEARRVNTLKKDAGFIESKEPVPGDSLILTLDLDLQQSAENALKEAMQRTENKKSGAAFAAIEVKSGEILAAASYPSYDITTFSTQYDVLVKDKAKPMFNRVFSGLYEPGSTFKPIAAIAAMESGNLKPEETIKTKGAYSYLDRKFLCNIFKSTGENHGTIAVSEALSVSCNYFFYEIGRRTGIDAIANYAEQFGLGEKTSEELSYEEARGKIATPENREKNGGKWYPGDVLQAAIGQSDNMFTPIALANYAATLANGGTNYKTRLVKAIKSEIDKRIVKTTAPSINRTADVSETTLAAVKKGMCAVTKPGGTAASVFAGFPVSVAGKTGTAQVSGGTNGLFICYAPAEDPQIAACVVLENGDSGTKAAAVARAVLETYFTKPVKTSELSEETPYALLQ